VNMLQNKNIILGICGSIASYKSAYLTRLLVTAGANVQVVMTKEAAHFITPLTLSTLSKKPVLVDYYKHETGEWNQHVQLGLWADIIIIAPITANTMAKIANGLCDNLLSAIYLSARCPVYFAPAMDLDMWKHPATLSNLQKLISYGNRLINPAEGELASGLIGEGRMAEPEDIVAILSDALNHQLPFKNKKALITAGPTYEAIDPVRFIGNHSSGKMGFAIAEELAKLGAEVTLITGPTCVQTHNPLIKRLDVISADDMLQSCKHFFEESQICVMSAAVADYTPLHAEDEKIKKEETQFSLQLKKTTDILSYLGSIKKQDQILVGFALETNNEEYYALKKLKQKNLDFIVLNSLKDEGAGFKSETNKITIFDRNNSKTSYNVKNKKEVAIDICEKIASMLP
jgi:phosphopantothenoylcysteine decarboxylase/phosphopantothenate--cysteine ligase